MTGHAAFVGSLDVIRSPCAARPRTYRQLRLAGESTDLERAKTDDRILVNARIDPTAS